MAAAGGGGDGRRFADLAVRSATAAVFGAIVMAALLAGGQWTTLLIAALGALMVYEWRMISLAGEEIGVAGFQVLSVVGACVMTHFGDLNMAVAFLFAIAGLGAAADAVMKREPIWGLLGSLYIGFGCILCIGLRGDGMDGLIAVGWIGVVVAASDVGGYFAGRTFGGPRLSPRISPSKTWSGLLGSMTFAAAASGAYMALMFGVVELFLCVLGAAFAVIATAGDIGESAYKRYFRVKDSGAMLPGHGGVLDRLDGMLAAVIFAALITIWRGGAPIHQW